MMENSSIKIEYDNLYVTSYNAEEDMIRLPISNIPQMEEADGEHIHGYLSIAIGGEKISDIGYFGEDDVCFNDWIGHLVGIIECFSTSPQSRFLFYDGEQGGSAFEFCRNDDSVYISHVDTEIYYSILGSEFFDSGKAEPEKTAHYSCSYKDFDSSARTFIEQIKNDIYRELGDFGSIWWELNTYADGRCSNIQNENINRKGFVRN